MLEEPMPLYMNNAETEIYCRHILFGLDLLLPSFDLNPVKNDIQLIEITFFK